MSLCLLRWLCVLQWIREEFFLSLSCVSSTSFDEFMSAKMFVSLAVDTRKVLLWHIFPQFIMCFINIIDEFMSAKTVVSLAVDTRSVFLSLSDCFVNVI